MSKRYFSDHDDDDVDDDAETNENSHLTMNFCLFLVLVSKHDIERKKPPYSSQKIKF